MTGEKAPPPRALFSPSLKWGAAQRRALRTVFWDWTYQCSITVHLYKLCKSYKLTSLQVTHLLTLTSTSTSMKQVNLKVEGRTQWNHVSKILNHQFAHHKTAQPDWFSLHRKSVFLLPVSEVTWLSTTQPDVAYCSAWSNVLSLLLKSDHFFFLASLQKTASSIPPLW